MTRLAHDPAHFADQAIAGFVAANRNKVRRVDGGVVRSTPLASGTVAVVIGGGSGHYPAFAGLVGDGMAAGAACGNIFASPSAGQVHRVARMVESGAGIVLTYGNYAGDVLNFGQAEERLRAEGYDVRTVLVTDDIASAAAGDLSLRRGIAGDLAVFKVAGAAAASGRSLDLVEELARQANANTRSIGVAFTGATLPGSSDPLFSVPEGAMAIGLGIHGEPGIGQEPVPSPRELADDLVARLLAEATPLRSNRAAVILNGLGGVKYEELFVVFGLVADALGRAGVAIVSPECGELVTSLDMAGLSLTIMWLDEELEELWTAPADTPAFSRSRAVNRSGYGPNTPRRAEAPKRAAEPHDFIEAAPRALVILEAVRETLIELEGELGRIDAIAGDGDHGLGMSRGVICACDAASRVVEGGGGVVELLADAAEGWAERGGGTSGALWGIALTAAASSLAGCRVLTDAAIADAVSSALGAVQRLGRAVPGDKTMVDAFVPFAATLADLIQSGTPLDEAWRAAAERADNAAIATADLLPRLGRARPHAEKSVGHPDAGAVSFAAIVTTVADRLAPARLEREGK